VKIVYKGHACFLVDAREGRVLTDPYDEDVPYDLGIPAADVVTVSHDHGDHNAVHRVAGSPAVFAGVGRSTIRGIPFLGVASFHDEARGSERGDSRIVAFTLEGIRLAHFGDLGTRLDGAQRKALADVEIAFIPVGGLYTIDASRAADVVRSLPRLRVAIPMHYRTDRTADWPIETVEPFLEMMDNVRRAGSSEVEVSRERLPEALEVWTLDHA
jgi:L-ascorbate metabolism protein UlaG (beta-lactamase superfamily)